MSNSELVPGTLALTKGIHVLRAISAEGRQARFTSLLAATGLPKATLYRILKALVAEGLVRLEPRDNTYHLGLSFLRLAFQVLEELDIRELAHEDMMRLSEQTNESIHLAILDGLEAVYIDMVESSQPVNSIGRLGSSSAIYAAASGKVIAANLAPEALDRLLQDLKLVKLTKNTITSQKTLRQQFAAIRECGYAVNEEEETEGIRGVAAPVFNISGEVIASIGISIPSYRFHDQKLSFYTERVIETARIISEKLGNAPDTARNEAVTKSELKAGSGRAHR